MPMRLLPADAAQICCARSRTCCGCPVHSSMQHGLGWQLPAQRMQRAAPAPEEGACCRRSLPLQPAASHPGNTAAGAAAAAARLAGPQQAVRLGIQQHTLLTKVGDRLMPAPASTMEERVSPTKSVDTTASVVKLQGVGASEMNVSTSGAIAGHVCLRPLDKGARHSGCLLAPAPLGDCPAAQPHAQQLGSAEHER